MSSSPLRVPVALLSLLLSLAPAFAQGQVTIDIPVTLTGNVVREDGSPLPEPMQVEMVCRQRVVSPYHVGGELAPVESPEFSGNPMKEAVTTSASGDFGFRFNVRRRVEARFQYASQQVDLTGCEVSVTHSDFQSDVIHLGIWHRGDNPDIGTLVIRRQPTRRGIVSVRSLQAPEKARRAYERARGEFQKENPDLSKAAESLENAVAIYPEYASAWHLLGRVRLAREDHRGARQAFEKAVAADPDFTAPYLGLASMELRENRWQQLADLSQRALELNPDSIRATYYLALARFSLGDPETAEGLALKVRESERAARYPVIHYILGAIWTQRGEIGAAAAEFRRLLELKPEGSMSDQARAILAHWERQGMLEKESDRQP